MPAPKTDYILESDDEVKRLTNQHDVIKDEMGPQGLVLAPIDLSGEPLRILDSATADGTCFLCAGTRILTTYLTAIRHLGTRLGCFDVSCAPSVFWN